MAPKRKVDGISSLNNSEKLAYQEESFFNKKIDDPAVYNKNKYIYINIVITELDVYKNLLKNFSNKIIYSTVSPIQNNILNNELVCQYVFMRLFRFLFFLDFFTRFCPN